MGYNARNDEIRDNITRMHCEWKAQRGALPEKIVLPVCALAGAVRRLSRRVNRDQSPSGGLSTLAGSVISGLQLKCTFAIASRSRSSSTCGMISLVNARLSIAHSSQQVLARQGGRPAGTTLLNKAWFPA